MKKDLAGWAAIIAAIAAVMTAIGAPVLFPDLVKRIFPESPTESALQTSQDNTPSASGPSSVDTSPLPHADSVPTSPSSTSPSMPAPVDTDIPLIRWSDTINGKLGLRGSIGQQFTFQCPPSRDPINRLYGTDIYTGHSSVCEAAVHAGVITQAEGGNVTIEVHGEQQAFTASQRSGVVSKGHGRYSSSFTIIR